MSDVIKLSRWQPISEAPKDSRILLTCIRRWPVFFCWYRREGYRAVKHGWGWFSYWEQRPYCQEGWFPVYFEPQVGASVVGSQPLVGDQQPKFFMEPPNLNTPRITSKARL